jgi:hypothetical protein
LERATREICLEFDFLIFLIKFNFANSKNTLQNCEENPTIFYATKGTKRANSTAYSAFWALTEVGKKQAYEWRTLLTKYLTCDARASILLPETLITSQPWFDATCPCTTSWSAYFRFVTLFLFEKTRQSTWSSGTGACCVRPWLTRAIV